MDWPPQSAQSPTCIYCGDAFRSGAVVCKDCGRWRKIWRNGLSYWSGFTGLATFILSGGAFLFIQAESLNTRLFGADLQFRNVSSAKELSVVNNSGLAVILGTVTFTFPDGKELQVILDKAIGPGEVLKENVGDLVRTQTLAEIVNFFLPEKLGDQVDSSSPGVEPDKIVADLLGAIWKPYTVEAINTDGHDYRFFDLADSASTAITVPCTIEASYEVVRGRSFTLDVPCTGIVRHQKVASIGAPYPDWLLGMIHSFDPRFKQP